MSTEREKSRQAMAEYERLSVVSDLLFDISEAAWDCLQKDNYAHTKTEFAKLNHVRRVRDEVASDSAAALDRWAAPVARPASRRIERSR
ncbi:hypothetical protein ACWDYH_15205 [Nocardia goodfellowii]